MVKRYELDIDYDFHGNPKNLTVLKDGEYSDGYYVEGSDYEQLQQELKQVKFAKTACANTNKLIYDLEQERDALKAYCEELKGAYSFLTQGFHNQLILKKSPSTCLKEVEARAVENAASHIWVTENSLVKKSELIEYAQQLRETTKND